MKKLKLNKTEWNLCENTMDISARRRLELNAYWMLLMSAGKDPMDVVEKIDQFERNWNSENQFNCIVLLNEFKKGSEMIMARVSPICRMFALIVLSDEEAKQDQLSYLSEGHLDAKLNIMFDDGLKWGVMEELVVNFIETSSASSQIGGLMRLGKAMRMEA